MAEKVYCSTCGQKITRKSEFFISVKSFDKGKLNFCNIDCMFEYMREHDEYLLIGKKMGDFNGKSSLQEK